MSNITDKRAPRINASAALTARKTSIFFVQYVYEDIHKFFMRCSWLVHKIATVKRVIRYHTSGIPYLSIWSEYTGKDNSYICDAHNSVRFREVQHSRCMNITKVLEKIFYFHEIQGRLSLTCKNILGEF